MPLTKLQKGAIGENEFEKLAILETDGALQVGRPLTHDERRDREIYRRGTIAAGLAVQVRIRMDALTARQTIWITVTVARAHLRSSRRFWYFLGDFDRKAMRFHEPVFLVPSTVFHRRANPRQHRDVWYFHFHASLDPKVRDAWYRYRVETKDVGKRLLSILERSPHPTLPQRGREIMLPLEPAAGVLFVSRRPVQVTARPLSRPPAKRDSPRQPRRSRATTRAAGSTARSR